MDIALRITIAIVGLIFVLSVVFLLTKKRINERNSLNWILGSLLVIFLMIDPQTLNTVAHFVGVDYPPTLLFLVSILVILIILLHQSVQISLLQSQCRELAQRLALIDFSKDVNVDDHNKAGK